MKKKLWSAHWCLTVLVDSVIVVPPVPTVEGTDLGTQDPNVGMIHTVVNRVYLMVWGAIMLFQLQRYLLWTVLALLAFSHSESVQQRNVLECNKQQGQNS